MSKNIDTFLHYQTHDWNCFKDYYFTPISVFIDEIKSIGKP